MFNNVGKKIQSLAKVFAWIGIVIGAIIAISGIPIMSQGSGKSWGTQYLVQGFMFMIGGVMVALSAYLISLFLCAFGKISEDISVIRKNLNKKEIVDKDNSL